MEARRTHVAIMEQKMKEVEGGIDADQALALGAHTVFLLPEFSLFPKISPMIFPSFHFVLRYLVGAHMRFLSQCSPAFPSSPTFSVTLLVALDVHASFLLFSLIKGCMSEYVSLNCLSF